MMYTKKGKKDNRPHNQRKALKTMSGSTHKLCYALLTGSDIDDTLVDCD